MLDQRVDGRVILKDVCESVDFIQLIENRAKC